MAKYLKSIVLGTAAIKEPPIKMLPGERLTGRIFFPSFISCPFWMELWLTGVLILKGTGGVVPTAQAMPNSSSALAGVALVTPAGYCTDYSDCVVGDLLDPVTSDSQLAIYHGVNASSVTVLVEVEQ